MQKSVEVIDVTQSAQFNQDALKQLKEKILPIDGDNRQTAEFKALNNNGADPTKRESLKQRVLHEHES